MLRVCFAAFKSEGYRHFIVRDPLRSFTFYLITLIVD